jgi:hypothetical protein
MRRIRGQCEAAGVPFHLKQLFTSERRLDGQIHDVDVLALAREGD